MERRNGVVPDLSFCGHGVLPRYTLVFRNGDVPNKTIIAENNEDI